MRAVGDRADRVQSGGRASSAGRFQERLQQVFPAFLLQPFHDGQSSLGEIGICLELAQDVMHGVVGVALHQVKPGILVQFSDLMALASNTSLPP